MRLNFAAIVLAITASNMAMADTNRIDLVRPDAPELAAHGEHPVGVRTIRIVNPDQIDIVGVAAGQEHPRYNRGLTVEFWYPATPDTGNGGEYEIELRDGETVATVRGLAVRDAEPSEEGAFPLVIVSHGYPGSRFLLSHLAENLATKGYVVASVDHRDSTYSDQTVFGSTLVNWPVDHLFTLAEIDRMQRDLASVLTYVETLAAVDTTGVEPTSHVIPLATPMRGDTPEPAMDPARAVANAPEASGSAFVVPKVIAGEEEG